MTQYWVQLKNEYAGSHIKAMRLLLQFSATYLCKSTFSAMTHAKSKHRNNLKISLAVLLAATNLAPRFEKFI